MAQSGGFSSVGFVGVGNMGWPMAACLVKAGFNVLVNDSRREVANNFVQQVGGAAPDSLRQLAEASDVVITMLPTSTIVQRVLAEGDDNIFAGMKPGAIIIEMSSGVPSVTQRLAEQVAALGGALIDAPVSGGVPRAKTGELAIMAGGDAATIDKAVPVLSAMGSSVLRTGAVGSGQAMKALNNLVSTGGFLIGIEALLIGQRFGLDPGVMTDVLNAATGMNNSTQKKFRQFVLSRKFNAGFTMGLLAKDLSIALQVGRETGTAAPLSALVNEMIVSAQSRFGPDADHTEMAKLCELLAGSELEAD
ncbi:NAD(P)-dependent oxidoreductase [Rhodopila globiformis]|uniref:Hydroxyacid oxidoreductase n=1 Tax=Rhodopila globiformis TaxID=1071 RepID=A0A2S6NLT2_RHOGL|nr:NAD(P)-dependent oxidoreductase [Rhodopila globiformis]PPQ36472.1 hydroxyacid oxidoreductase [Rhodopila globiformis]